jgi:mono/diheme cytochrome c family protein
MNKGLTLCWLAAVSLLAPASTVVAADNSPAKAAYLRYCGACHGEDGKGTGVVSALLRPKPTDLTVLAKQNKGEFPFGRMIQVVDGRTTVRAHGDPDMPVWGEVFKGQEGTSMAEEAKVRGKLFLVIEYISSLQQK